MSNSKFLTLPVTKAAENAGHLYLNRLDTLNISGNATRRKPRNILVIENDDYRVKPKEIEIKNAETESENEDRVETAKANRKLKRFGPGSPFEKSKMITAKIALKAKSSRSKFRRDLLL